MAKIFVLLLTVALTSGEMVDLTHYNDNGTLTYPSNRQSFSMNVTHRGWWVANNPKIWLENDEFAMTSHAGTHMDSPSHFKKGGMTMDQVPLNRFISPAVVVDHSERCKNDSNDVLLVSDLLSWEAEHGRIPNGAMILARSGWSEFYNVDNSKYFGMADAVEKFRFETGGLNFPGISKEAAEWLVRERQVSGVAVETLSIDPGNTRTEFPAHVNFAAADILMIENVGTGIRKLPPSGAMVISLPMKNRGASGAPIRMFAYWGDDAAKFNAMTAGAAVPQVSLFFIAGIIAVFNL